MHSKKELRRELIEKRKNMTIDEVKFKSSAIVDKIISHEFYKKCKVLYCYYPVNNEVDLRALMEHAMNHGKRVALPMVENNDIQFYFIESFDDLSPGYYNIPEPINGRAASKGDLIIVPGVTFTENGERLGYGGGFYDRFFVNNEIYSIGVCYDFQIVKNIPVLEHDKIMDEIISN